MHRTHLFYLLLLVASLPTRAVSAPPEETGTPISADNAQHLKPVRVVEKRADRLSRGPKPGQWLVEARVFTPPNKYTYAAELVDEADFGPVKPLAPDLDPRNIVFSPDGKRMAFTQPKSTHYIVSDFDGGNAVTIEIGDSPSNAAFSPDGKLIAIGYVFWEPQAEGAGFSEVRLFDVAGKHIRTFESNGAGAIRPVFGPDGKLLAAGNRNYETQVFDVATGTLLHKHRKRMTQEHAFSPDGSMIAEGAVDGGVYLWETATGKLLNFAASGCDEIYSVDWSPQGDVFATSGRGGDVVIWDPKNLNKLKQLDAAYWVIRVRFSADGTKLLASSAANHAATADRKITVWAVGDDE